MNNRCKDCGKCCRDTEMILSRRDIETILIRYPNIIQEEEFVFKNDDEQYQLINIQEKCIFLESTENKCKIYDFRPKGCRFYPLIYDLDTKKCKLDDDCPRKYLFYEDQDILKKSCQDLKWYLKKDLKIRVE
ncbi:MAG: YkgJ family cysteine cluster protein [Candidatus Hermodarchaeota archaeon]